MQVAAQPETVFPYFTDPGRYVEWMGSGATLEPVPGGSYRVLMRDSVEPVGEFVEIDPPHRLVFTWGWTHDRAVPPGTTRVVVTLYRRVASCGREPGPRRRGGRSRGRPLRDARPRAAGAPGLQRQHGTVPGRRSGLPCTTKSCMIIEHNLSGVLNADVIGYIEVETLDQGERLSRHGGWADIGNLRVTEQYRRLGVATWLLGQAADWLQLAQVERLLDYAWLEGRDPMGCDYADYRAFLPAVGFRELTRNKLGWSRAVHKP
jgi:uncharacterized protein YndB with AHSA1/START domain/GNAT superfamily N-acetyltransferase